MCSICEKRSIRPRIIRLNDRCNRQIAMKRSDTNQSKKSMCMNNIIKWICMWDDQWENPKLRVVKEVSNLC